MTRPASGVRIKRAYEPPAEDDGARVLVDRLWPRGVSKAAAELTLWLKAVAPSAELRNWFGHDPARWTEFGRRYRAELQRNQEAVDRLRALVKAGPVTLVDGARDTRHKDAGGWAAYLDEHLRYGEHGHPA